MANAAEPLSGKARTALRARAHSLKPVVWIAESGITPGAMREIDRALDAHELIKIHAAVADRDVRAELLAAICSTLNAQPIQRIGKMLVVYRERPEPVTTQNEGAVKAQKPPREPHRPARGRQERRRRSPQR